MRLQKASLIVCASLNSNDTLLYIGTANDPYTSGRTYGVWRAIVCFFIFLLFAGCKGTTIRNIFQTEHKLWKDFLFYIKYACSFSKYSYNDQPI